MTIQSNGQLELWEWRETNVSTKTGYLHPRIHNPVGVDGMGGGKPRVAAMPQLWAEGCSPVGAKEAKGANKANNANKTSKVNMTSKVNKVNRRIRVKEQYLILSLRQRLQQLGALV